MLKYIVLSVFLFAVFGVSCMPFANRNNLEGLIFLPILVFLYWAYWVVERNVESLKSFTPFRVYLRMGLIIQFLIGLVYAYQMFNDYYEKDYSVSHLYDVSFLATDNRTVFQKEYIPFGVISLLVLLLPLPINWLIKQVSVGRDEEVLEN